VSGEGDFIITRLFGERGIEVVNPSLLDEPATVEANDFSSAENGPHLSFV
jgi:hypothetical protein